MSKPKYLVAVFGGAVAGSEAAFQLTQKNIPCVVFEQTALPYGKIEDGLPKWHVKLRDKEEEKINTKLNHPLVSYVPNAKLGDTIDFEDVASKWGFSAILLATGAWADRPLPIEGIDQYLNKGLIYQNPFIYWFNHKHEPDYSGPVYPIEDGAIVVGGGLASLDVVKVLMLETVQEALEKKGHQIDIFTLDRSIAKVLDQLGLSIDDLGIKGCTLFYRRRMMDMPLSPLPAETQEQLAKAQTVRKKICQNFISKYLFKMEENRTPVDKIVENGRLSGIVLQETRIVEERVVPIPGSEKAYKAPLIISSIGSIPEPIPGVPTSGQVFNIEDHVHCKLRGYPHVFALGNAVTGRGNIIESQKHGKEITQLIIDSYLEDPQSARLEASNSESIKEVREQTQALSSTILKNFSITEVQFEETMRKVKLQQQKSGYDGNFRRWIETHLPLRLEAMLGVKH